MSGWCKIARLSIDILPYEYLVSDRKMMARAVLRKCRDKSGSALSLVLS